MKFNQESAPYHNKYDPSKRYTTVMSKPGKALQARELTEMQSIFRDMLKRVSDTMLTDGGIVSGMSFTISESKVLTVESGLVYLEGLIHIFEQQGVQITGVGEEKIGIKLKEELIDHVADPGLKDPAVGHKNYLQAGADRIRSTIQLTLNDTDAVTIYTLIDGEIQVEPQTSTSDMLLNLLARRTYDESGNYKVSGLTLSAEEFDDEHMMIIVDAGKAYILGYEFNRPSSTRIKVPKAKATRMIQNESFSYYAGNNRYALNNIPVRDIARVQAEVLVTRERMIRGTQQGGTDFFTKNSVSRIERVWQEQPGGEVAHEFKANSDYQLVNAQGISWSPDGAEPPLGGTYYVTYRYNKTMEPEVDYKLAKVNDKFYVEFVASGTKPVADTVFYVDYNFFLSRKDLVSMNREGQIIITSGQPDVQRNVVAPINSDPTMLPLGTVTLLPNSAQTIDNTYAVTRLSMEELQDVVKRVHDIEYNQAVSALDDEAMAGENPTELKGILSDGFYNLNKCDLFHEDFDITLDIERGTITLPTKNVNAIQPTFTDGTRIHRWDRVVTAPLTEVVLISQPLATQAMLVNPYNVFNKMGVLVLNPAVDNFINETVIKIDKQETKTYQLNNWWLPGGSNWTATERELYNSMTLTSGSWNNTGTKTGTILSSSARTLLDESAQFMREITVEISATNLLPHANGLKVMFDGRQVEALPKSGTYLGNELGTLKADGQGNVYGSFKIPPNTPCGTRSVVLENDNNSASGNFTSLGRNRIVERTTLTTRIVLNAVRVVTPVDPLAQSFQLSTPRILSSVGLYFGSKSTTDNVIIQLRDMVNGYPGTTVYAETVLTPAQINVSDNASAETRVKFKDPVLCEANTQYCFAVLTDSDVYTAYVAELGKKNIADGETVTRQPYLAGTLFSSANALTWTAHQTMDMKFNLYGAQFAPTGAIEFEPVTNVLLDRLVLLSEYLTPNNTGCEWYVRILNTGDSGDLSSKTYAPIGNYEEMDLSQVVKAFQLKAEFKAEPTMSPILALDALSLIGMETGLEGAYVSRNVVFPEATKFTTIKQIFEGHIPNGCSIIPSFSINGGTEWVEMSGPPTVEPIDTQFNRYTYTHTLSAPATLFRAKLKFVASNAYMRPKARKFMNICK